MWQQTFWYIQSVGFSCLCCCWSGNQPERGLKVYDTPKSWFKETVKVYVWFLFCFYLWAFFHCSPITGELCYRPLLYFWYILYIHTHLSTSQHSTGVYIMHTTFAGSQNQLVESSFLCCFHLLPILLLSCVFKHSLLMCVLSHVTSKFLILGLDSMFCCFVFRFLSSSNKALWV